MAGSLGGDGGAAGFGSCFFGGGATGRRNGETCFFFTGASAFSSRLCIFYTKAIVERIRSK